MVRESTEQKIRLAFAETPYPGDDEIAIPNGRDDGENVKRSLCGKTWQMVEPSNLLAYGLGFMTAKAFRHYLPAYLLAEYEQESTGLLIYLTPPELKDSEHDSFYKFETLFQDFTALEKQGVSAFIDDLYEEAQELNTDPDLPDLDEKEERFLSALRYYWNQF